MIIDARSWAQTLSLVVLFGLAIAHPTRAREQTARGAVEVTADQLTVDHGRRAAVFKGQVRVSYGTLKLRCEEMRVSYGEDGQVQSLRAQGRVVVEQGRARAEAATARLDVRQGLLVLEGSPSLTHGAQRIEGDKIEVDLNAVEIRVVKARGRFKLDLEPGR